jgi:hypothetical protein
MGRAAGSSPLPSTPSHTGPGEDERETRPRRPGRDSAGRTRGRLRPRQRTEPQRRGRRLNHSGDAQWPHRSRRRRGVRRPARRWTPWRAAERWHRGRPDRGEEPEWVDVAETVAVATDAQVKPRVRVRACHGADNGARGDRPPLAHRNRGERHVAHAPAPAQHRHDSAARSDPARDNHAARARGPDRCGGPGEQVDAAVPTALERIRPKVEPARHRAVDRRPPGSGRGCGERQEHDNGGERGGGHFGESTGARSGARRLR